MTTTPTPGADDAPGPYDTVTIRDVFAWLDTLRGWDIATHVEYEALRNVALARLDALEAARRDAEARAKRLNDALRIVAAIADERGKRLSPYSPDTLSEDAQSEMGLHPGDLDKGGAA